MMKRERPTKAELDRSALALLGFLERNRSDRLLSYPLWPQPTQLAVLIQLADFWWDAGRKPFPKKADLAQRLGLSERPVQRYFAELEEAGFVQRIERRASHRDKISNEYDLHGFVKRLAEIEPDSCEATEEARAVRKAVARPGVRPRAAT